MIERGSSAVVKKLGITTDKSWQPTLRLSLIHISAAAMAAGGADRAAVDSPMAADYSLNSGAVVCTAFQRHGVQTVIGCHGAVHSGAVRAACRHRRRSAVRRIIDRRAAALCAKADLSGGDVYKRQGCWS